jgi:ketosteroid isomerase-like protein
MSRWMLVALLVCAASWAGHAQEDSDADTKSKIIAMEHVWAEAYRDKDPRALARILDDGFVCVSSDGKLYSKDEILADVKASDSLQLLMDSMVVRLHGDAAIITGIFRTTGLDHGKPFARRERFVDTWLYRNRQWISISSIVTSTRD